jgi:hypothetical protein
MKFKMCPDCLEVLPRSAYLPAHKDKPEGGLQAYCKRCTSLRRSQYRRRIYTKTAGRYVWTGQYR